MPGKHRGKQHALLTFLLVILALPARAEPFDLDGDKDDASVSQVDIAYDEARAATFVKISGPESPHESTIRLADGRLNLQTWADARGLGFGMLGKHFAQGPSALQTLWIYALAEGSPRPRLYIVDPNAAQLAASFIVPDGYTVNDTWFGMVQGPSGRRYPFVAPGARYLNKPHWQALCQFAPQASAAAGSCGAGFRQVDLRFQYGGTSYEVAASYRHNGGWLDDDDGDGFSDIHLPYLMGFVQTISGRTGQQLAISRYDAAQTPADHELKWFHSGRNYGSFTPFVASGGQKSVLVMAANAVGTFEDYFCNVSRFAAVLTLEPATHQFNLRWSQFTSFVKHIFSGPQTNRPAISRRGDGINLCMHRTGDNTYDTGAGRLALYSVFSVTAGDQDCTAQQLDEVRSGFDPLVTVHWDKCAKEKFLATTGTWSVIALDLETGKVRKRWPGHYLWLIDDASPRLLLETMPAPVRFDRRGYQPERYIFATISPRLELSTISDYGGPKPPPLRYQRYADQTTGDTWGGIPRGSHFP